MQKCYTLSYYPGNWADLDPDARISRTIGTNQPLVGGFLADWAWEITDHLLVVSLICCSAVKLGVGGGGVVPSLNYTYVIHTIARLCFFWCGIWWSSNHHAFYRNRKPLCYSLEGQSCLSFSITSFIMGTNVTMEQLKCKPQQQSQHSYRPVWVWKLHNRVHPLYPAVFFTHLIMVHVNVDSTVIFGSFGTMNHIRFCKGTTEKQQFEDGKSESLRTQLYTCQVSHFLYDMPVITIIIK